MSLLPRLALRHTRPLRSVASAAPGVRRHVHASRPHADHYRTLDVPRTASLRDIKAQFYRLSKKWHPDVNRDNEGAKARFQEVSEAWATLGDERARREYDRRLSERSGSSSGAPGASSYSSYAPRGAYDESDNTARRARASYAWDYQRRQRPASASEAYHRHGASASAWASAAAGGGAGTSQQTAEQQRAAFDTMVSRNRFREQAAAARAAEAGRARPTPAQAFEQEGGASMASAVLRFAQVAGLFTLTFWAGSKFAGGGSGPLRAEGRGADDEYRIWLEGYRQVPARTERSPQ